ncbi:hypothetical protein SNEBB_001737 [Seison nebaliae]|nr:hypothetical protein SNEBB_001737 [Seison nebaliae]
MVQVNEKLVDRKIILGHAYVNSKDENRSCLMDVDTKKGSLKTPRYIDIFVFTWSSRIALGTHLDCAALERSYYRGKDSLKFFDLVDSNLDLNDECFKDLHGAIFSMHKLILGKKKGCFEVICERLLYNNQTIDSHSSIFSTLNHITSTSTLSTMLEKSSLVTPSFEDNLIWFDKLFPEELPKSFTNLNMKSDLNTTTSNIKTIYWNQTKSTTEKIIIVHYVNTTTPNIKTTLPDLTTTSVKIKTIFSHIRTTTPNWRTIYPNLNTTRLRIKTIFPNINTKTIEHGLAKTFPHINTTTSSERLKNESNRRLLYYYQRGILELERKLENDTIEMMLSNTLDECLSDYIAEGDNSGDFTVIDYAKKLGNIIMEYTYQRKLNLDMSLDQIKELRKLILRKQFSDKFNRILKTSYPIVKSSQLKNLGLKLNNKIIKSDYKLDQKYILMGIVCNQFYKSKKFRKSNQFSNFSSFNEISNGDGIKMKELGKIHNTSFNEYSTSQYYL